MKRSTFNAALTGLLANDTPHALAVTDAKAIAQMADEVFGEPPDAAETRAFARMVETREIEIGRLAETVKTQEQEIARLRGELDRQDETARDLRRQLARAKANAAAIKDATQPAGRGLAFRIVSVDTEPSMITLDLGTERVNVDVSAETVNRIIDRMTAHGPITLAEPETPPVYGAPSIVGSLVGARRGSTEFTAQITIDTRGAGTHNLPVPDRLAERAHEAMTLTRVSGALPSVAISIVPGKVKP